MNKITFLITFLIAILAVFKWIKGRRLLYANGLQEKADGSIELKFELVGFCVLIIFALAIRLYKFGTVPGGMNQDGAMAAVDAKALADYGTDRFGMYMPVHFTAWGSSQMSVLMSYCMVPFIKLFGLNTVTARLPILIFSMIGLIALYFCTRYIFGVKAALITLFLAVVNPWHFIQSRWALDCNMFPHVFMVGLFLLLCGVYKNNRYTYVSMIFFGLSMYCYGVSIYTVPFYLLIVAIYMLKKRILSIKQGLICVGIYLLIAFPFIMTMAINTFGHKSIETPLFTIPYFPDSVRSRDILFFSDDKLAQLKDNIHSLLQIIWRGDDLIWNTCPKYGVINKCLVPFFFLGIYYVIYLLRVNKNGKTRTGYVCLLTFLGIGLWCGIITASVNVNRVNILHYSLIIFAGIGIYFVYLNIKRISYVVFLTVAVLSVLFFRTYFTTYAEQVTENFSADYIEAISFANESDCKSFVFSPCAKVSINPDISEILTLFALEIDAGYFKGEMTDENGLTYSEKYCFDFAGNTDLNDNDSVAYVITYDELYLFDEKEYSISQFGRFYTVIPN